MFGFCVTRVEMFGRRDPSNVQALVYNQPREVREDTHLFVPTVLPRWNQNVSKGIAVKPLFRSFSGVSSSASRRVESLNDTRYITDG